MKRFVFFGVLMMSASSGFAYYGDYSSSSSEFKLSGWIIFISIIMIVWAILEIILFFKLWGMTNDIRALKMDYFNESYNNTNDLILRDLRKNLILGNIDNVKRTLLKNFMDDVQYSFWRLPDGGYEKDNEGSNKWVSFKERNQQKSIRPYIENLQKQFKKIGLELPIYIEKMETYSDFFNLFVEEDLVVKKKEENGVIND